MSKLIWSDAGLSSILKTIQLVLPWLDTPHVTPSLSAAVRVTTVSLLARRSTVTVVTCEKISDEKKNNKQNNKIIFLILPKHHTPGFRVNKKK